jgi:hypothetical protein
MIEEALRRYPRLVIALTRLTRRLDGSLEQIKADVQLADGSRLHLNEVYVLGQLRKYSYYRLSPTGEVIQGWDNAPHHPEIASYPHHLHQEDAVHPSRIRSLADVLAQLAEELRV